MSLESELAGTHCRAKLWAVRLKQPQEFYKMIDNATTYPVADSIADKFELECLGPGHHTGLHEFLGRDGKVLVVPEESVHYR